MGFYNVSTDHDPCPVCGRILIELKLETLRFPSERIECARAGGPKVNPRAGPVVGGCNFAGLCLLTRQTKNGVVYTDGKMDPPQPTTPQTPDFDLAGARPRAGLTVVLVLSTNGDFFPQENFPLYF